MRVSSLVYGGMIGCARDGINDLEGNEAFRATPEMVARASRPVAARRSRAAAEISQRHLSFLESGRAEPSREMVLRLVRRARRAAAPAERLDARGRLRAGVARERSQRPGARAGRRRARLHAGAAGAVSGLRGRPALEPEARQYRGRAIWSPSCSVLRRPAPVNLADALVAPDVLRPFIENWEEVAVHFLRSVQADAIADGTEETAEPAAPSHRLSGRAAALARRAARNPHAGAEHSLPQGRYALRVFTTIATLGTPQDVTLQEIRIECFFPSDAASAALLRAWVGRRDHAPTIISARNCLAARTVICAHGSQGFHERTHRRAGGTAVLGPRRRRRPGRRASSSPMSIR